MVTQIKDISAKIATKEEAFWLDVVKKTETELETLEKMLTFNRAIAVMAKQKAKENSR